MTIEKLVQSYHVLIDEFLLLHQEALVAMNFELAFDIWCLFSDLLQSHIEVENQYLMGVFSRFCGDVRWPMSLYLHEHHKIIRLQSEVTTRLNDLQATPTRRGVVMLLDYQRSFKNVIEHHEEREEIALLKELQAQVPADVLAELMRELEAAWPSIDSLLEQKTLFEQRLASLDIYKLRL